MFLMANSLAHTKWVCKYHIVFTPKYRRKIIYKELRKDIQQIIKDLCKWKGVEIMERCDNSRSGMLPGSCTYSGKYTAQIQCIPIHGIPQREKCDDDI